MKTGALYIRVSTDDQVEYSPDAQIRLGIEYAKKNGIIIPKKYIFQDDGISGRKANNRPAFQQMIGLARSDEHPVDVIIVWKFSRFARNQEEAIVYKNLLKKSNVDVVSVSEPIPEGFIGELVQRIFEWMDEYYSINLSGEVLRGMTERAMSGQYNTSPPLGYKMVNGIPTIVPEQAEIVTQIFNWYIDGMSFFDISKKLNALGYKTKRGGKFQNRTVAYIIRNEFYIGKIVWNRLNHDTRQLKDPSEWVSVDGNYETFISEETFNLAKERDKSTSKVHRSRPISTYKHWLSGMLVCSCCGGRLVKAYTNKDGSVGFQCTNYNHAACHESHSVSENKIVPAILEGLQTVIDNGSVQYTAKHSKSESTDENELLLQKINAIDVKEERIKEAYRDGIDTIEEYKHNKELLQAERDTLTSMLTIKKETPAKEQKQMLNNIKSAYDVISGANTSYQQKHEAISSIVDKIVYDKKNDSIAMHFYIS